MIDADAGKALENEIGSAVGLLDTRANETETGHARVGGGGQRFIGHSKHARSFQGLVEHGAVTRFKDMEREKVMGKEDSLGKNHHPHLFGQIHESMHTRGWAKW